jgi:predicted signal transduction protein with EAL and GGDEF domain
VGWNAQVRFDQVKDRQRDDRQSGVAAFEADAESESVSVREFNIENRDTHLARSDELPRIANVTGFGHNLDTRRLAEARHKEVTKELLVFNDGNADGGRDAHSSIMALG